MLMAVLASVVFIAAPGAWTQGPVPLPGRQEEKVAAEQVRIGSVTVSAGMTLEVHLKKGKKIRGRVSRVTENELELQTLSGDRIEKRKITPSDLKSLKRLDPDQNRTQRYLVAGLGAGLATLTVIILAAVGAL
jgi:hypothetical protein